MHISLIGLVSIVLLIVVFTDVTRDYSKITNELYLDLEGMNALKECLYQHQALIFEHLVASTDVKKCEIEESAEDVADDLRALLLDFGDMTSGTKYESYYHDIYSGIVGYLNNVAIIFDFSSSGDSETAQYYMNNSLEGYISDVDDVMESLDDLITEDMDSAKSTMNNEIRLINIGSFVLLGLLFIYSIFAQIVGGRVSNMMVNLDTVTGINNYSNFLERMEKRRKKGTLGGSTILAVNIKGFQFINQRLGNRGGDEVLRQFALFIQSHIGKNDLVARSSSDGFVVLMPRESVDEFLASLFDVSIDVELDDAEDELGNNIKAVIGVKSRCGYYNIESGDSVSKAIENAALALKIARESGESSQICYEEKMLEEKLIQTQTIHDFRDALENKEFIVYFQPRININEKKLCGAEALVRWRRNEKIISPRQFIPVLEQEGFISELDYYVLNAVCDRIEHWQVHGRILVPISVNISNVNLRDEKAAERIIEIISKYDIDRDYLEIELTESDAYTDLESLGRFADKLKNEGIRVIIDDFGTGYSSMSLMKIASIDGFNLDRNFIGSISDEADNTRIKTLVYDIVRMARNLGKRVTCVGVETLKQEEILAQTECSVLQGYLYDRPMPQEEFEARLIHSNY